MQQLSADYWILDLASKSKDLKQILKSVGFGIGSTMQAAQQVMAGVGVDLKDSVGLERFM